jgi:hypothetical protein
VVNLNHQDKFQATQKLRYLAGPLVAITDTLHLKKSTAAGAQPKSTCGEPAAGKGILIFPEKGV